MKNKILIKNINIVDVINNKINEKQNIIIYNGKISSISSDNDCSEEFIIIDGKNQWVIPSFVDMHAHLTFEGREFQGISFNYYEDIKLSEYRICQNLIESLISGVCLIRDVGNRNNSIKNIKKMLDNNLIIGPEIILSGKPLCIENGHGFEFGQTLTEQSIDCLLDNHIENGYEWLKVMNGPELFSQEDLNNIVNKAHFKNIKIAAHVFTEEGIKRAIIAGVNTIEHSVVYNEKLFKISKEKNISFVPTYYSAFISQSELYLNTVHDFQTKKFLSDWYDLLKQNFKFHISSGLNVLTGTDAGATPCTFSDIVKEIIFFYENGLTEIEAIRSATIYPSKVLGRNELFGSISINKWANLVFLNNNPLNNIYELTNINEVWFKGKRILYREK